MSTELPTASAGVPLSGEKFARASTTYQDGIKESFPGFSSKVNELDKQLGKLRNDCRKLGRVAGLVQAIENTREALKHSREVFFHVTKALVPDLPELPREDCHLEFLASSSEQFCIPSQYHGGRLPPSVVLPKALERLAGSFHLLHMRIEEFQEFTDEGSSLQSLLLKLDRELMYRASYARFYSDLLDTSKMQCCIHQFINELQAGFEEVAVAVGEFTAVGVSTISHEQARSSSNLANILTVSTFFSGVTATTLQMSITMPDQNDTVHFTNLLWFISMIFSVGAALNSLLAISWKSTRSGSRGGKLPIWVTIWIDGSQLLFLGISIVTFSTGLIVFAFASSQAPYTPYLAVASTAGTFIGLVTILLWMSYEKLASSTSKPQAEITESSRRERLDSDRSKVSIFSGIAGVTTNALPFLRSAERDIPRDDIEKGLEKSNESEDYTS